MKYLYLVDYWVPFPTSEYGGLINVIAKSDIECHDILLDWRDEYTNKYDNLIMEKVTTAVTLQLANNEESGIVETFTTQTIMEERLYRIEELATSGWHLTETTDVKLTREQAKARLESLIREGYNPERLRAIPDTP